MTDERPTPASARRTRVLSAAAFLVLWAACNVFVPQSGWDPKRGPVVPHDTFPADCTLCHMGSDWHTLKPDFTFDHMAKTGRPLNGAHAAAGCLLCHNDAGPVAQFDAKGCAGCHVDPHSGQLGRNCTDCHNESTWQPREAIARHDRTRFPLVGAHAATACFRCHPGAQVGNFVGASADCSHCHAGEYTRATFDHVASGDTTGCERCHRPTTWTPAQFDHPASFPLTLGHGGRSCTVCHPTSTYTGLSTACASCHLALYTATTSPGHAAAGFSTNCEQCHTPRGWGGGNWQHTARFPLTNGHATMDCTRCHIGGNYTSTSAACASCHIDRYNATTSPPHASSGFGTSCEQCHDTRSWQGASFNHRFPITSGAHRNLSCNECHTQSVGPNFSCIDCHEHSESRTRGQHDEVRDYSWVSSRCYQCHPNGRG